MDKYVTPGLLSLVFFCYGLYIYYIAVWYNDVVELLFLCLPMWE